MKNLAIIQARLSSSRLPGKVLKKVLGKPIILYQLERVLKSKLINKVIIATSIEKSDDDLCKLCLKNNIDFYRGSLNDVLSRFYNTYKQFGPSENIIRLTGDCPLIDPKIIDKVILKHLNSNFDYTSNTIQPSWPDGFDVEVINSKILEVVNKNAKTPYDREHVTSYIYKNKQTFKLQNISNSRDWSKIRLTLDFKEDFELIKTIISELYPTNANFKTSDIFKFLNKNAELSNLNSKHYRNSFKV